MLAEETTRTFVWEGEGWVISDFRREIEREIRPTLRAVLTGGRVTSWAVHDPPPFRSGEKHLPAKLEGSFPATEGEDPLEDAASVAGFWAQVYEALVDLDQEDL